MTDIAEICTRCAWQKDGKCYGRPPNVTVRRSMSYELGGASVRDVYFVDYTGCSSEIEQNGMPCPQWKEREDLPIVANTGTKSNHSGEEEQVE